MTALLWLQHGIHAHVLLILFKVHLFTQTTLHKVHVHEVH